MSSLKLDLRVGDSVDFDNGRVKLTLLEKSGQRARFDIDAKDDVKIKTNKNASAADIAKNGLNLEK